MISILKILCLTVVLILSGCAPCCPPVEPDNNDYYLPDRERNLVPLNTIWLESVFALPIIIPERIPVVPPYVRPIEPRFFPVQPWVCYSASEHRPSYGFSVLLIRF